MSFVIVYTVVPSAFILSPPSVIYAIAEMTTIKMIIIPFCDKHGANIRKIFQ